MSKRASEDLLTVEGDSKRFCPEDGILDSAGTLIIRETGTGEEVAIIQEDPDVYDAGVEEGQMTIHIAEDVMQDEDDMGQVVVGDNQHVAVVSESGETVSFSEAVEVPVTDASAVLGDVGGEMVMADNLEQVEGVELEDSQYQNIIIQHMDIEEPLTTLKKSLEARLQCSLVDHEFYLQDAIPLDPTKNLVSQCVEGTGMVQINVEVKSQPGVKPRLNIVDILKPADEVLENEIYTEPPPPPPPKPQTKVVIPFPEESENVTRWVVDQNFRKEQDRLKIPFDPAQWNSTHVRHWIQWAIKEFKLVGVNPQRFMGMSGRALCNLKHEEFVQFIPHDTNDVFWTHLELLRKCKFVAVIQQPTPHAITTITVSTSDQSGLESTLGRASKAYKKPRSITIPSDRMTPGNRTGNNGQIQLWQFLLELLTDKEYQEVIHWVGDEGEFKLNNHEMVAQLWGQRKNKPSMNYEKLSRALRYYYDGDMIAKVHGKRFVYKFVIDLRMLLGYSAGELHKLVRESSEAQIQKNLVSRKYYKVQ